MDRAEVEDIKKQKKFIPEKQKIWQAIKHRYKDKSMSKDKVILQESKLLEKEDKVYHMNKYIILIEIMHYEILKTQMFLMVCEN